MTRPLHTRSRPKTERCGKCGRVTPLAKLYCQVNADGAFLVTEPSICIECHQALEAARWAAATEDSEKDHSAEMPRFPEGKARAMAEASKQFGVEWL